MDQGNIIRSFVAHTAKIQGLQFNADGSLLASSSEDSTIKLWETNDWKLKRTFIGHQSGVYEIVFSPNGQLLLSGSDDDTARLWSVASGKEVISPIELHSPVWAVEFSPDGKTIVAGCEDSTVQFWELANSGTKATLHDHFVLQVSNGPVWWLRFQKSAGAVSLGIASQDRTVKILHMDELQTLFAHPDRLENDAKGRGGLIIGQGTDGEPTIVAMPPAEFSTVENEQANPN